MKYTKKPVVVDAVQWFKDGDHPAVKFYPVDPDLQDIANNFSVKVWTEEDWPNSFHAHYIKTLEGWLEVNPGDWIIKNDKGNFEVCKPDFFEMTYEVAK